MSATLPDTYLSRFAADAAEAEREENEFRRGYAARLATLERTRVFANRRHALVKALSAAIEGAEDAAAALKASERVLEQEFGLSPDSPAHQPILASFGSVADEIDKILNREDEPDHGRVVAAISEFERWYQERTGSPFMALYDVYVQATPVVDF